MRNRNIFIIAGEPSGDMRGAELLRELKPMTPDISFWGIGGDNMSSLGVELIEHVKNLSIIGVWEAILNAGKIKKQYALCVKKINERKPDAAILIDYPGFNLLMTRFLKKQNIPVIYYVIPQVWAWGEKRTKILKKYTDKIIVILDFEKQFLARRGVESDFVGHPIVKSFGRVESKKEIDLKNLTVAILPGSRESEVRNILPVMLSAARKIDNGFKNTLFTIAQTHNVKNEIYEKILAPYKDLKLEIFTDNTFKALEKSDFAVVTSGTATLETVLTLTPMVITYKSSFFTRILFDIFAKVKFVGLVNIMAGKEIAPEMIRKKFNASLISKKVIEMLENKKLLDETRTEIKALKERLGKGDAAKRAAEIIKPLLQYR